MGGHCLAAQCAEDCGRVGGGNDGSDQQRRTRRQVERERRTTGSDRCCDDDAHCREQGGRRTGPAHGLRRCRETTLEQDDDERNDCDVLGEPGIREMDEGEPVVSDHHAEDEEQHQAGEPVPLGDAAHDHADDHESSTEENSSVDGEAAVHPKLYAMPEKHRRSQRRAPPGRVRSVPAKPETACPTASASNSEIAVPSLVVQFRAVLLDGLSGVAQSPIAASWEDAMTASESTPR